MKPRQFFGLSVIYAAVLAGFLAAANLTSAVTTSAVQSIPIERFHTIVIDPGHGGEDGGATSVSGILESRYNLEIVLKLQDVFHLLGYSTKMIRTEDISVYTQGNSIAEKKVLGVVPAPIVEVVVAVGEIHFLVALAQGGGVAEV